MSLSGNELWADFQADMSNTWIPPHISCQRDSTELLSGQGEMFPQWIGQDNEKGISIANVSSKWQAIAF